MYRWTCPGNAKGQRIPRKSKNKHKYSVISAVNRIFCFSNFVLGAENFANPAKVRLDGITKTCFRPISICASDTQ